MMRPRLQFRRHVRPIAVEARAHIADAHLVSTAIAALAEAPERQRFAIQPANRVEGGVALRRLLIRRQALVEEAAPSGFSASSMIDPFAGNLLHRPFGDSPLCTSSLRGAQRRSNPQLSALTGLLRGTCHRAGHFGPDPLARKDETLSRRVRVRVFAHHHAAKRFAVPRKKREAERRKAHPTVVRAAPSDVAT